MTNRFAPLATLILLFGLPACSPSRLSNGEIDRLCELAGRCGGSVTGCVNDLLAARDLADSNGCAAEFASLQRCYLNADSCSASASCVEAEGTLVTCSTRPRDAGPVPDGGGDWVTIANEANVATATELCAVCPATLSPGACDGPLGATPAEQDCQRAVGRSYPEVRQYYECVWPFRRVFDECAIEAARLACPPNLDACATALNDGAASCLLPSDTALSALDACTP